MSAPVDVLAVLKKEADYSGCLGPRAAEARTKRLLQVHAAVAELIEANRRQAAAIAELLPMLRTEQDELVCDSIAECDEARADGERALARVGGGK